MSDELDNAVLGLVARLLGEYPDDARLVRKLWRERLRAVQGLQEIRDWDLLHSEALALPRVISVVNLALDDVGEE